MTQKVLGEVFFIVGLTGGIIFVLARIFMALVKGKAIQENKSPLTKIVLWETMVCFIWGIVCFGLAWIAKEKISLGLLISLFSWCLGGIIIGADSLRRISRSRIAWQVILVFAFFIAIHLIIKPEGYDTTITKVNPVLFLFMLIYIVYYLTFGIRALRKPSKRTRGLESMKKLTAGIFCFWFLWALPLYSGRFTKELSCNSSGDIFTTVISLIVLISVLFCLGGKHLKELSGKEIIYVLITVVGMLLSISPMFILMGLVTY